MNFCHEFFMATRFGLVGLSATVVHITIVWLLLEKTAFIPIVANSLAFLFAFGFSFAGNYVWTFRSPGSPRRAMFRFFMISACAFTLNSLYLFLLIHKGWFSPVISAMLSASAVPVITFMASRIWGFEGHKKSEYETRS
jgi:putative flippase GtrA